MSGTPVVLPWRAAISGHLTGNYFTIRLDRARQAFETLPWVAQASVRRIWPNRLRVTLTEHRALGQWSDAGCCRTRA